MGKYQIKLFRCDTNEGYERSRANTLKQMSDEVNAWLASNDIDLVDVEYSWVPYVSMGFEVSKHSVFVTYRSKSL